MNARLGVILLLAMAMSGAACGQDAPGAPSGSLTGTWSGPAVETGAGTGSARLSLQQNGSSLNGTISTTFGGVVTRDGAVQGTVTGTGVSLGYTPSAPLNCGGGMTLTGTVLFSLTATASRLTGVYSSFTCGGAVSGSVELAGP